MLSSIDHANSKALQGPRDAKLTWGNPPESEKAAFRMEQPRVTLVEFSRTPDAASAAYPGK
jgi:hypothetical protein